MKDLFVAETGNADPGTPYREACQEQARTYRSFLETMPDAFVMVDINKKIIWTNPAFRTLVGYTQEELPSLTYDEITPRRWRAEEDRILKEQVFTRGYSDNYEKEYIKKDGSIVPVKVRAYMTDEGGGRPIIWAFVRDITANKQAREALQASEEKFRLLFEQSVDPILLLDGQQFQDCNQAALMMMECADKEQLLGMHPAEISPKRQPDGELSCEKSQRIMAEALETGSKRFEWLHRTAGGREVWVEVSITVIPIKGAPYLYTVWRDIGARKRAGEALRRRERELEEKNKRLEEVNTAFRVVLKYIEDDKKALENRIFANLKQFVIPYMEQLRAKTLADDQIACLNIIEANLQEFISPFSENLNSAARPQLTPMEIQVADLIRAGKTSKIIARILNISEGTVNGYRNNIRDKLGLLNRKIGLRSHLLSLKQSDPVRETQAGIVLRRGMP